MDDEQKQDAKGSAKESLNDSSSSTSLYLSIKETDDKLLLNEDLKQQQRQLVGMILFMATVILIGFCLYSLDFNWKIVHFSVNTDISCIFNLIQWNKRLLKLPYPKYVLLSATFGAFWGTGAGFTVPIGM